MALPQTIVVSLLAASASTVLAISPAAAMTVDNTTGSWTGVSGGASVTGLGTADIRWSDPPGSQGDSQSGSGLAGLFSPFSGAQDAPSPLGAPTFGGPTSNNGTPDEPRCEHPGLTECGDQTSVPGSPPPPAVVLDDASYALEPLELSPEGGTTFSPSLISDERGSNSGAPSGTLTVATVPQPLTLLLVGIALVALAAGARVRASRE